MSRKMSDGVSTRTLSRAELPEKSHYRQVRFGAGQVAENPVSGKLGGGAHLRKVFPARKALIKFRKALHRPFDDKPFSPVEVESRIQLSGAGGERPRENCLAQALVNLPER